MIQKVDKIWLDGQWVDWDKAEIHILTHTLHYGLGVFEGVRCYECTDERSAIFRLKEHIARLFESATMMTLTIPFDQKTILEACCEVFRINKLKHGYLRPLVFIGDGEMGLYAMKNQTRVAVIAWPWGTYLGEEGLKKGIRARIASLPRYLPPKIAKAKANGLYVNSILAKREALTSGFEEAIMLDTEGYVSEATGENLFMVKDGKVHTAPLTSSILNGITRDTVITFLKDQKIPVEERLFTPNALYKADEVFLTGTAAEVTPVREVDRKKIGPGRPGPITQKMQELFFAAAHGENPKYQHWLTYL